MNRRFIEVADRIGSSAALIDMLRNANLADGKQAIYFLEL